MHLKTFWLQVIEVHLKVTKETRTKLSQIIRFQLDLLQTGSGDSSDIGQALSFSLFVCFTCLFSLHEDSFHMVGELHCNPSRKGTFSPSIHYQSQGRFQRAWPELRVNARRSDGGGQELIGGGTTWSARGAVLPGKGQ